MTLLDFAVDDGFTMFQLSDPLLTQAKVTTVDKYQGQQNDFIIATWNRNFTETHRKPLIFPILRCLDGA